MVQVRCFISMACGTDCQHGSHAKSRPPALNTDAALVNLHDSQEHEIFYLPEANKLLAQSGQFGWRII
jgi:hypothetical protein